MKSKQKLHIPSSWSTTASADFSFSLTVAALIFLQGLRGVNGRQHPPWRHWAFTWVLHIPSGSLEQPKLCSWMSARKGKVLPAAQRGWFPAAGARNHSWEKRHGSETIKQRNCGFWSLYPLRCRELSGRSALLSPRGVWEAAGTGGLVQEQDEVMFTPWHQYVVPKSLW